jgi:hypothetical protein
MRSVNKIKKQTDVAPWDVLELTAHHITIFSEVYKGKYPCWAFPIIL